MLVVVGKLFYLSCGRHLVWI